MKMKVQEYYCEHCGLESHITYPEHEDVLSVVRKIEDDHKKWSPECPIPVTELRVINDKLTTNHA